MQFPGQDGRDQEEVPVAGLDLDTILEGRNLWQFFRDRRPQTHDILTAQSSSAAAAAG